MGLPASLVEKRFAHFNHRCWKRGLGLLALLAWLVKTGHIRTHLKQDQLAGTPLPGSRTSIGRTAPDAKAAGHYLPVWRFSRSGPQGRKRRSVKAPSGYSMVMVDAWSIPFIATTASLSGTMRNGVRNPPVCRRPFSHLAVANQSFDVCLKEHKV